MKLHVSSILQSITIRLTLSILGLTPQLQSRMELASPDLSLDHLSHAAFLSANTPTTIHSISPTPYSILVPWMYSISPKYRPFAAVVFGSLCDVIAAEFLARLATTYLHTCSIASTTVAHSMHNTRSNCKKSPEDVGDHGSRKKEARSSVDDAIMTHAVASMYLWNPLSILVCVSASAAPFVASTCVVSLAAGVQGNAVLSAASLAVAAHCKTDGILMLMLVPSLVIAAAMHGEKMHKYNIENVKDKKGEPRNACSSGSHGRARKIAQKCTIFVSVFVATLFTLQIITHGVVYYQARGGGMVDGANYSGVNRMKMHSMKNVISSLVVLHYYPQPWSNIQPNLGLQWYLFSEVFPQFRYDGVIFVKKNFKDSLELVSLFLAAAYFGTLHSIFSRYC